MKIFPRFFWRNSVVVFAMFVIACISPLQTYAQIGGATAGGTVNGSVKFGSALSSVISCSGITSTITDGIQNAISSIFSSQIQEEAEELAQEIGEEVAQETASASADGSLSAIPGEPVMDAGTHGLIANLRRDVTRTIRLENQQSLAIEKQTKDSTKWMVFKENCLDRIAREVVVRAMNRATFTTVEFINSGFEGDSFFLTNPVGFFNDIARDEIGDFKQMFHFDAEGDFQPFGGVLLRTILQGLHGKFQQNLIVSMQSVLNGYSYTEWQTDFSLGGWAAYTAMVEPNNNIIGAYIESGQEINRRLSSTRLSYAGTVQQELNRGLGYLAQKECVATLAMSEPTSYLPPEHPLHMPSDTPFIYDISVIPPNQLAYITDCDSGLCELIDADIVAIAEQARKRSICTQWKTLTPGNWIMSAANSATIDSPREGAWFSDELHENLGLILDALFLQAFEGMANMFDPNGNYSSNPSDSNYNASWAALNDPDFSYNYQNNFDFGNNNNNNNFNNFNLFENLDVLIDFQIQYRDDLLTIMDTLAVLIQRTLELDYCVPGPYPTWLSDVSERVNNGLFSVDPAPVNYDDTQKQIYYAQLFADIAGANLDYETANITSVTAFQSILLDIYGQYLSRINEVFTPDSPPSMRQSAANYYNQMLVDYIPALEQYQTEYDTISTNILDIQNIIAEAEGYINQEDFGPGNPQYDQLQNQLTEMVYLVDANDISQLGNNQADFNQLVSVVTASRDLCIIEVTDGGYNAPEDRRPYIDLLSDAVESLETTNSFLEGVSIGEGDDTIMPTSLPTGSFNQNSSGLETFENFIGPLY